MYKTRKELIDRLLESQFDKYSQKDLETLVVQDCILKDLKFHINSPRIDHWSEYGPHEKQNILEELKKILNGEGFLLKEYLETKSK